TPAVAGKPSRWLLDVVLPTAMGSGQGELWAVSPVHRTLIQTDDPPRHAPQRLARLLAQLDAINAAGIVTVTAAGPEDAEVAHPHAGEDTETVVPVVRFRFNPFRSVEPGHHYDPEYR